VHGECTDQAWRLEIYSNFHDNGLAKRGPTNIDLVVMGC
jgi:hypothetical protein